MAINYDFYKTTGALNENAKWFVRPVGNTTVGTDEIIREVVKSTTLTEADLKAALSAISEHLSRHLKTGRNVHLDGIGHFSISIGGRIECDKNDRPRLKNAKIRSVNFRTAPALQNSLRGATFTAAGHKGHHSSSYNEAELMAVVEKLCRQKGQFTRAQFAQALNIAPSTAYQRLKRLCAEGKIVNAGTRAQSLYRLPDFQK